MSNIQHYSTLAKKRKKRVRKKIFGTKVRPRLTIFRSNRHISLQVIDDEAGKTLIGVTDIKKSDKTKNTKTEKSIKLAQDLVKQLKTKKISSLVFDRGSYKYHGRVKAVAETLRAGSITI